MGNVPTSTKEVTRELHITKTSLYRWIDFFELSLEKTPEGKIIFTEELVNQLREIKALTKRGKCHKEIKTILKAGNSEEPSRNSFPPHMEIITPSDAANSNEMQAFFQNFWHKLEEKDRKNDLLQENNADLRERNASLSSEVLFLRQENDRLKEEQSKRRKIFGIF